jgi:hypothetical protein
LLCVFFQLVPLYFFHQGGAFYLEQLGRLIFSQFDLSSALRISAFSNSLTAVSSEICIPDM